MGLQAVNVFSSQLGPLCKDGRQVKEVASIECQLQGPWSRLWRMSPLPAGRVRVVCHRNCRRRMFRLVAGDLPRWLDKRCTGETRLFVMPNSSGTWVAKPHPALHHGTAGLQSSTHSPLPTPQYILYYYYAVVIMPWPAWFTRQAGHRKNVLVKCRASSWQLKGSENIINPCF